MTAFVTLSENFALLISMKLGGRNFLVVWGSMWACAATAVTPGTVETFVTGLGLCTWATAYGLQVLGIRSSYHPYQLQHVYLA
jgi:hypothetical protein